MLRTVGAFGGGGDLGRVALALKRVAVGFAC